MENTVNSLDIEHAILDRPVLPSLSSRLTNNRGLEKHVNPYLLQSTMKIYTGEGSYNSNEENIKAKMKFK